MKISYIVSVFNSAERLPCLLWSLRAQTEKDFEVIVADNSTDDEIAEKNWEATRSIIAGDYLRMSYNECYSSAERAAKIAVGDFLCFPSDDSYYVPTFGETMLHHAMDADLIMCSILYDPRCGHGRYTCCPQKPERAWFDKTGFILRRSKFPGFENKVDHGNRYGIVMDCADGLLAERLVRGDVMWKSIPDVLVVHN